MRIGGSGVQLIEEIKLYDGTTYFGYNDEQVQNAIDELLICNDEIHKLSGTQKNASTSTKILMLFMIAKRQMRCLFTYHYHRLHMLMDYVHTQLHHRDFPDGEATPVAHDCTFMDRYATLLGVYRDEFTELSLFSHKNPPKDLYVHVRVVKDCGTVETEDGCIVLKKNSLNFVKISDIDNLIQSGFLEVVNL